MAEMEQKFIINNVNRVQKEDKFYQTNLVLHFNEISLFFDNITNIGIQHFDNIKRSIDSNFCWRKHASS